LTLSGGTGGGGKGVARGRGTRGGERVSITGGGGMIGGGKGGEVVAGVEGKGTRSWLELEVRVLDRGRSLGQGAMGVIGDEQKGRWTGQWKAVSKTGGEARIRGRGAPPNPPTTSI
jgi:hypothetical protein